MQVDAGMQLAVSLLVMFFGALLAGALPWMLTVRESQLRAVTALGGGLLIGTSLAIVIPEGFHALAEAGENAHDHVIHGHSHDAHSHDAHSHSGGEGFAGLVLVGGFLSMLILDHIQHAAGDPHGISHSGPQHHHGGGQPSCGHSHGHSHGHGHGHGGGGHSHGHSAAAHGHASPPDPGPATPRDALDGAEMVFDSCDLEVAFGPQLPPKGSPQRAITGLMIHCAADGLAMGAAALSGDMRLSMMIAIAMIVHKAPMAFGLATYLMNHRWSWARAQGTMVLFAAMAPIGATATYLLLGHIALFTSTTAVALVVLFSGGTFLYAATMHILPEVLGAGCHLTVQQIAAVTLGGLLPVLLSFGHEH